MRIKLITLILLFFISGCDGSNDIHPSEENIVELERKLAEEINKNKDHQELIANLNKQLSEVQSEKENMEDALFSNALFAEISKMYLNIDNSKDNLVYSGIMWESVKHSYSEYYLSILYRTLFKDDYKWIESVDFKPFKIVMDDILNLRNTGQKDERFIVGIKFTEAIQSSLKNIEENIQEVWFQVDNGNYLHTKDNLGQWRSYEVFDSSLLLEYQILQLLIEKYNKDLEQPA